MYHLANEHDSVGPWKLVVGLERIPNLSVFVVCGLPFYKQLVPRSWRDETCVCLTFIFHNNKKYSLH